MSKNIDNIEKTKMISEISPKKVDRFVTAIHIKC